MSTDNYPPGFNPAKELDESHDRFSSELDRVVATTEVKYRIVVEVEGEEIFNADYLSINLLEENGLRKAERATEKALEDLTLDRLENGDE